MSRLQVVSGIIENGSGEVLLAQRPPGKKLAGLWEFPGGKIDGDEDGEAALKRELKEELELDVRIEKFLGIFPHNYDWGSIDLHVYIVKALGTPEPTADVQVFKWTKPALIQLEVLAAADVKPLEIYLTSRP